MTERPGIHTSTLGAPFDLFNYDELDFMKHSPLLQNRQLGR